MTSSHAVCTIHLSIAHGPSLDWSMMAVMAVEVAQRIAPCILVKVPAWFTSVKSQGAAAGPNTCWGP